MSEFLFTVRGNFNYPFILKIDTKNATVRRVEFPRVKFANSPPDKRGTTGIDQFSGVIAIALWDRILFLERTSLKIIDVITSELFSDLHGIHFDEEGTLWITSTNIDGVLRIRNGKVEPFWIPAIEHGKSEYNYDDLKSQDFRNIQKAESGLYAYHINSVTTVGRHLFVSYLGLKGSTSFYYKLLEKVGLRKAFYRRGGVFVLNKNTKKIKYHLINEGLHDPYLDGNLLYYTEYFSNRLFALDTQTLRGKYIPLEIDHFTRSGNLCRGLVKEDEDFWVGHTKHRGWYEKSTSSLLRKYNTQGRFSGKEILLEDIVGVYHGIKI